MPSSLRCAAFALVPALAAGCYQGAGMAESTGTEAATSGTAGSGDGSSGSAETGAPATTTGSTSAAPTTGGTTTTGAPGLTSTGPDDMSSGTDPIDTGPPDSTGADTDTGAPVDPVAEVCGRWQADRSDMSEGTWSGAVAGCAAGDTGAPGRDNALRLVNLYRWLAGLPAVDHDAGRDAQAQACALMMHANGMLSHDPGMGWECFTAAGAEAAMKSNISSTQGVVAVDLYMVDPGNATTFGHRRWILSNGLGPIGLGSTAVNSCMWVVGGQGGGAAAWTAWPPPGVVPLAAIHVPEVPWADVDGTGWTIHSDSIDVSQAQVTITEGGALRPVVLTPLQDNVGSAKAIAMTPQGWVSEAGKTYTVQVNGVPQPFSYDVQVVACP